MTLALRQKNFLPLLQATRPLVKLGGCSFFLHLRNILLFVIRSLLVLVFIKFGYSIVNVDLGRNGCIHFGCNGGIVSSFTPCVNKQYWSSANLVFARLPAVVIFPAKQAVRTSIIRVDGKCLSAPGFGIMYEKSELDGKTLLLFFRARVPKLDLALSISWSRLPAPCASCASIPGRGLSLDSRKPFPHLYCFRSRIMNDTTL